MHGADAQGRERALQRAGKRTEEGVDGVRVLGQDVGAHVRALEHVVRDERVQQQRRQNRAQALAHHVPDRLRE